MALFRPERPLLRGRSGAPGGPAAIGNAGALTGSGDISGASAGPGVGAFTGSGAIAGGGAALIASAATFSGSGSLAGVSNATFPLAPHSSGRYLVSPSGTPFLLCADTTWSLLVDIPLAGVSSYFSTLVSQGFNAVMGNAIEHRYTTAKPPKERGGLLPFTQRMDGTSFTGSPNGTTGAAGTQGQFASDNYSNINNQSPDPTFINNAYWVNVEAILDAALANSLAVLVWPGYLGFHNNDEGWLNEMVVWDAVTGAGGFTGQSFANASKSKLWNYGAWMAARWKAYPHIIWVMGGDYGSNSQTLNTAQASAVSNLMAGLKSVAGQNSLLFSAHWDRPALSTDTSLAAGTFDLNGCYADEAVAELARRGYATTPARPTIGLEYFYENDLFGGSTPYRKYVYWQFLGGIAGGFYGHEQLWRFDTGSPGTDWTTLLATTARLDAVRQFALWKTLPWHRLKPSGLDGMTSLITTGGGTASPQSTDYVAAAATPEGDLLLAYVPPAHTGSITVAMTAMAATCRARWFDPTNSSFTSIGMIANTGTHAFTPPANNNAGDTDFLLVLDMPVGSITGAGDLTGAGAALATGTGAISGTGALAGTGAALATGTGALAGSGELAGAGAALATGTGAISGTGALAGAGAALATGTGAISGTGDVTGNGATLATTAGTISGTGALAGAGAALATGTGAISGTGDVTGNGAALATATGAISGTGALAGAGAALATGTGTISGTGAFASAGMATAATAATLSGTGDIAGATTFSTAAAFSGAGTVSGAGAAIASTTASFSVTGDIAGTATTRTTAAFDGTGTLAGAGRALASTSANFAGTGDLAGSNPGLPPGVGVGSFSGSTSFAGVGAAIAAAACSFAGSSTLSGRGSSLVESNATATVPPGRAPNQLAGRVTVPSVESRESESEHLFGVVRSRRDV